MSDKLFTVAELSEMLKLHPKTIVRFINEGKISGNKVGRAWTVTQAALNTFMQANQAQPEPVNIGSGIVRVSAVVEIFEQDSGEAQRLSTTLMAMLNNERNGERGVRYDFFWQPETKTAKHVFYASPRQISDIMNIIDQLRQ